MKKNGFCFYFSLSASTESPFFFLTLLPRISIIASSPPPPWHPAAGSSGGTLKYMPTSPHYQDLNSCEDRWGRVMFCCCNKQQPTSSVSCRVQLLIVEFVFVREWDQYVHMSSGKRRVFDSSANTHRSTHNETVNCGCDKSLIILHSIHTSTSHNNSCKYTLSKHVNTTTQPGNAWHNRQ